ncbi:hypothetical protein M378DRAFT_80870 [Amanita muscaria Koide BX008]|uniref:CFA20 domain-containing protein n=1 Tax=Amanita muscaria (strain Koide BX008) TaxID=946122 RepID=A0A0C2X1W3_AMAMK|nr:hypothetical protein M378DRAFT_80870 [Amanita muscaria Koide BX008]
MFSETVQSPVLSLFSSTNSDALRLFSTHSDPSLPAGSFIHFLHDATDSPPPMRPACPISPDDDDDEATVPDSESGSPDYTLDQTVLHIQSPTLRTTYIHSPPIHSSTLPPDGAVRERLNDLHVKHSWMHVQVRNMRRDWSLEVGLVDQAGRTGIVRLSTFQKQPRLITNPSRIALLHLPLAFPHSSSRPLTAWSTLSLHLPYYLQYFKSLSLLSSDDHVRIPTTTNLPVGTYSHVSYVRVYATCRLRRIWFADSGSNQELLPWEFQLYGFEYQER